MTSYIEIFSAKPKVEVELLSVLAPSPRWLIPVAEAAGITSDHFGETDTLAIFEALKLARQYRDVLDRALCVRRILKGMNCYQNNDYREFISGSLWGDGAISALFHRMPADPALVKAAAVKLINITKQVEQLRQGVAA